MRTRGFPLRMRNIAGGITRITLRRYELPTSPSKLPLRPPGSRGSTVPAQPHTQGCSSPARRCCNPPSAHRSTRAPQRPHGRPGQTSCTSRSPAPVRRSRRSGTVNLHTRSNVRLAGATSQWARSSRRLIAGAVGATTQTSARALSRLLACAHAPIVPSTTAVQYEYSVLQSGAARQRF